MADAENAAVPEKKKKNKVVLVEVFIMDFVEQL